MAYEAGPVVKIEPGALLDLASDQWQYGDGPLRVLVERVRHDLSRYYDGKVWIEGVRLDAQGRPIGPVQALVRTSA